MTQPGAVNVEPEVTAEAAPVTESAPAAEAEKPAEAPAEPSQEGGEKKEEPAAEPAKTEEKPAAPAQKTQKEKQADLINQFVAWARAILGFEEGKVPIGSTSIDVEYLVPLMYVLNMLKKDIWDGCVTLAG
ncbi:hypothetical protein COOONC_05279 [Cooperia oncophora]